MELLKNDSKSCATWLSTWTLENNSSSEKDSILTHCADFVLENPFINEKALILDFDHSEKIVHRIFHIIYIVACVFGLVGNCMVVYFIARYSRMHSVTNLFLANVALVDIAFLLCIPLLVAEAIVFEWPFGKFLCQVYTPIVHLNFILGSLFLVAIVIYRYVVICWHIHNPKHRIPIKAVAVATFIWILSILIVSPTFYGSNAIHVNNETYCSFSFEMDDPITDKQFKDSYITFQFFLGFALPLVITGIFFALMIPKLNNLGDAADEQQHIIKLVFIVVMVHLICWAPIRIIGMAAVLDSTVKTQWFSIHLFRLANLMAFLNSAVKPILYYHFSGNFGGMFKDAALCCCCDTKDAAQEDTVPIQNANLERPTVIVTTAV